MQIKKEKFLLVAIALVMAFVFVACGGDNSSGSNDVPANSGEAAGNPNAETTPDVDLGSIIGGIGKPSDYNTAARQVMIDAARAEGGDLAFKADGSMVYTDADGSVTIQKPDGSWEYTDADGSTASTQVGGDWPDNEFTKLLPRPDFAMAVGVSDEGTFSVVFTEVTADELKAYVEKVKAAGFDVDADTQDEAIMGMAFYNYTAQNKDGYEISVFSASSTSGLNITKP